MYMDELRLWRTCRNGVSSGSMMVVSAPTRPRLLLIAEKLPRADSNARAYVQRAIDALKDGLARAPANPYAWARLAYAEALSQGWTRWPCPRFGLL